MAVVGGDGMWKSLGVMEGMVGNWSVWMLKVAT